jgi:hypothetical protein
MKPPQIQDEPPQGDTHFLGVRMRERPAQVPAGYLCSARNARFDRRRAEPRRGVWITGWTNEGAQANATPFSSVQGAVVFRDPNSVDWFIIAAENKIFITQDYMSAREIALPAGETITGDVEFTQCFSELILHRGEDQSHLVMRDINLPFSTIAQRDNDATYANQNLTDGTSTIPNASRGLSMQNRLFLPYDKDYVAASDYQNYTRYQPVLDAFRVNAGDSERITAIHEFNNNTMVVLKDKSVHVVENVYGNLANLTRTRVTDEYGCVSPKSVITVGKDVWFMAGKRGVSSITQTEQNKYQGVDVPVSQDIEPLIERINWNAAAKICAAKVGNFSYWGVPLDGSSTNNAVLVYDHLNRAWAGHDEGTIICPKVWLVKKFRGVERLFMLTETGYLALYDELARDQVTGTTSEWIDFAVKTRGYALRSTLGRVRCKRLDLQIQTWNPQYSVAAHVDGVNEETAIATDKTRSRTVYDRPFNKAPWDSTNVNDDHATPFRGDYSAPIGSAGFHLGDNGVQFSLQQEATESFRVPPGARGQSVQFELTSDQGRVELHAVMPELKGVDGQQGRRL